MAHFRADFRPTRWSLVAKAASSGSPEGRAALEELYGAYWWPLYVYLRKIGLGGEEAADIVQGLFTSLLEKNRLANADPAKGRFRSWLLQALKFHLSHERERQRTAKRGGAACHVSLSRDDADRRWANVPASDDDPEQTFTRAWALEVLSRSLRSLEAAQAALGNGALFEGLKPTLVGETDGLDLGGLARRLGKSPTTIRVAAHRMRKALGVEIRRELLATLDHESEVEEEIRCLFASLAKRSAIP